MLTTILFISGAYLAGSVSSAILICKLMGLPDPRSQGSKNPGATNVLRVGGKLAAALTLAGDLLKGLIPVLLAVLYVESDWVIGGVAIAAFLGHLYPIFFGFKGGKGVATALGVYLGLHWLLGLAVVGTWLASAALFRISSLSALIATLLAPAYSWWILGSQPLAAILAAMTVVIYWRHRSNIQKILKGTESRIGDKKKSA